MADKVLRIGVIQGITVIEERLVRVGGAVSFGTAPGNTFVLQGSDLPKSLTVFDTASAVAGGKYLLIFDERTQGQVELTPGRSRKLADLKGEADKTGDKYRVKLEDTSRGRIKLSPEITMLFHFVPTPAAVVAEVLPAALRGRGVGQLEPIFTAVLLASFLMHSALALFVNIAEPPKPPELEDLRRLVEQIAPPKIEVPKVPVNTGAPETPKGKEQDKASEPTTGEGDTGGAEVPKKSGGGGAGERAAIRDAIASKGILQLIGGRGFGDGGGAIGSVFGAGGAISDDIGTALAGTAGVGIAGTGGGVTRRGEGGGCGGGGGGGAADIGDLDTGGGGKIDTGEKRATRVVARVRADDVEALDGKVDQKGVTATIRRRQDAFQACYENALKANSKLQGKLAIEFTIGEGGKVTDARVVKDGLNSAEVASCVVATMKRIRFPAPADGEVTLSTSFVFQPG